MSALPGLSGVNRCIWRGWHVLCNKMSAAGCIGYTGRECSDSDADAAPSRGRHRVTGQSSTKVHATPPAHPSMYIT